MPSNELPPNAIDVATAVKWVDNWRASSENLPVKGFWIPKIDMTQVLAEANVEDIRSYMAIDDDGAFHLLIVGVDSSGNDMLDPDLGQYVYDFTRPCPAMCSNTGPLR